MRHEISMKKFSDPTQAMLFLNNNKQAVNLFLILSAIPQFFYLLIRLDR